jgi:hypothetical protein
MEKRFALSSFTCAMESKARYKEGEIASGEETP